MDSVSDGLLALNKAVDFNMNKTVILQTGTLSIHVERTDIPLEDLFGFGSRNNPKRGYLFISKVLGKHYPNRPSKMREIYRIFAQKLSLLYIRSPVVFVALAETATGLGQGIYEEFMLANPDTESVFIHTTRYILTQKQAFTFDETHSHATDHILYEPIEPADKEIFYHSRTLILIDDELSTGNTFINLILRFKKVNPHIEQVIFVVLTNWINQEKYQVILDKIQCNMKIVSILDGHFEFEPNPNFQHITNIDSTGNRNDKNRYLKKNWGRLGYRDIPEVDMLSCINHMNFLNNDDTILVLGTGEFLFFPFKLAEELENQGFTIWFQSTTRSPILIDNDIHYKIEFEDNYFDQIPNFVYNVYPNHYDQVIVCYETNQLPVTHDLIEKLNAHPKFF
ncbi:MAG: phosphoribosyltransferase domain-containing protein [Desulfobacterales bacterium]|nr:phosphoribosyltransferase domain-containing protein [Desulfobacterales bacterium]